MKNYLEEVSERVMKDTGLDFMEVCESGSDDEKAHVFEAAIAGGYASGIVATAIFPATV